MGYWLNHGTDPWSRWGPGHRPASAETWPVPPSREVQTADLREQVAAWVEVAEDLAARRETPPPGGRRSQQSPEERQRIRLKAMRLAWDKRGRPWNEAEALGMLREVELRGEVRVTPWPAQVR